MQTFNFPMHSFEKEYPESSKKITFGRGYEFVSKPRGPDQVKYILSFAAMKYFITGGVINRTVNPTFNIATLEDFYLAHKLYEKFIYPSMDMGNLVVRFQNPLKFKQKTLGLGTVDAFTLELMTQP